MDAVGFEALAATADHVERTERGSDGGVLEVEEEVAEDDDVAVREDREVALGAEREVFEAFVLRVRLRA